MPQALCLTIIISNNIPLNALPCLKDEMLNFALCRGNWYCSAVDSISYTNFPGTGFYNKVTKMIAATGQCETEKHSYSGSLAPLNEEVRTSTHYPILGVEC